MGKYEESIIYFDRALAIDENNATVLGNKDGVLIDLGKYEEAISYLDRALEIYLILMSISDNTFYIKQKIQILIVKLCSDGSLSAAPVIMPRPIDFRISGKDNFVW